MFEAPTCKVSGLQHEFEDEMTKLLQKEEKRFPLSPSRTMTCYRQLSYDVINYVNPGTIKVAPFNFRKLLVFASGHKTEAMMGEWLAKLKTIDVIVNKNRFLIHENKETGFKLDGEIDFLVKDRYTGNLKLLDVKETNTRSFADVKEKKQPKFSHYIQQQEYMHSKFLKDQYVKDCILLYINKDTQEVFMLEFPYDESQATWGINRLEQIYNQKGNILPREYLFGNDWQCNALYCQYHDACYSHLERQDLKPVVIQEPNEFVDNYLKVKKANKDLTMQLIYELMKFGDSHEYHYQNRVFRINKLKTTLSLDLLDGAK